MQPAAAAAPAAAAPRAGGGTGGTGAGRSGGAGGGGSGGTVELDGSAVHVSSATVNTQGGEDGDGSGAGANGQLLIGSDTAATITKSVWNAGSTNTVTITAVNNFAVGTWVDVEGIAPNGYDGHCVITAANATSFSYALPINPGTATSTANAFARGLPGETGVGNLYYTNTGMLDANPFIKGSPNTPLIAGLQGGAQTYGLVNVNDSLYGALTAPGGALDQAINNAPSNALVAVVRQAIPSGADLFYGYDLVLYVNLTDRTLAAPRLGVTEGGADATFDPALAYDSLANNTGMQTIQAIPSGGIFAILVPSADPSGGQYVNAALSGSLTDVSGQPLSRTGALYITVPFGTQTAGLQLPGLQAVTVTPDGHNVYAVSVTKNVLVVANNDLSERQTIAVSGLTAASQVVLSPDGQNVYVTEPGTGDVAVFTRNTTTGALTLLQTLAAGTNVTGALAINAAGTQAFLGGSGGLKVYARGPNGSLGSPGGLSQPAGLGAVTDLAFSQDGKDLYAVSQSNNAFVVLNPSNLSAVPVASFSGSADGLIGASAVAVSNDDQYVYVTGETGQTLAVFQRDLTHNTFTWLQTLQQGVQGVSGLAGADGVAVSTDDKYVYVTGQADSLAVFERQSSGTLLPVQVLRGTQGLNDPGGIAVDQSGVVYVTSQQGLGVEGGGIAVFNLVPPIAITAASWSNNTVTITAANDFHVGQPVTISGITGSLLPVGYDGAFTVTSATSTSFTYALTTNPGTATLGGATAVPTARAYAVLFNTPTNPAVTAMSAVTLTAGDDDNTLSMVHDPSVANLNIVTGDGNNLINLLDVPGPGQTPAAQTIAVTTGTGVNQVSVYADQRHHTYNITMADSTQAGDFLVLDGNPANDANDTFTATLGGNDTAQVNGGDLPASDAVNIDGGPGFNTLLYNALYNGTAEPINPATPLTPNGTITLVGPSVATVVYEHFDSVPGFVGPTTSAGGTYTITEGNSLTLNGSATAATNTQLLGISWDLTGDGVYGDAVDPTVTFPATSATSKPTITWAQLQALGLTRAGTYTIGMQVVTTDGTFYAYTTLAVQAGATAPAITNAGNTADVGEPYTISFAPTTSVGDQAATSWTIAWGDGTSTTLPSDAPSATHVYTGVGTDTVRVTVTDVNGATASTTHGVSVVVDASSLSAGGPYTIDAGDSLTLTATADGAPTTAEWDLKSLHTYADASAGFVSNGDGTSTSTVTLTWTQLKALGITDSGAFADVTVKAIYPTAQVPAGFLTSTATTLTINDVAPTATLSGTATEGGTGSVTFSNQASFVQPSGFLYSYDVGNTGTFQATNSTPTFTIPAGDLYQSGSLVVRGRITDKHGLFSDDIITVTIANQPPTIVTIDGNKLVNANTVVALTNVTFSDPGQDVIAASIDWGDSTTSQGVVATTNANPVPTTGTVSGTHAYAYRTTPYTVTVTLTDDGGAKASRSFQVTVLNPALSVTAGPSQTISEGGLVSLTGATFTDPAAPNTYTATVDWGDGTIDTNPTLNAPASAFDQGQVFDNHYYGQPGHFTVTVSVLKPNATPVQSTFTATVNNVLPTVDAGSDVAAGVGVPVHVNATFSDLGFPDNGVQEAYTATILWGDGSSSNGTVTVTPGSPGVPTTGTITGSHQYNGDGPYTVTVSVGDGSGTAGSGSLSVTAAPAVVTPSPSTLSGEEGSPVNLNATFSDPGFNYCGTTKSFVATIDWGDNTTSTGTVSVTPGSATTPTTGTVTATHVYTTFGTFPVVIHLTDEGGVTGDGTLSATITNLAPSAAPLPDGTYVLNIDPKTLYPNNPAAQAAKAGVPFILSGTFTDPGIGDNHTVTVTWGDGTTTTVDDSSQFVDGNGQFQPNPVEPTATSPGSYTVGHLYYSDATDGSPKTVTVTVTDGGGLSSQVSRVYSSQPVITSITPPLDPAEGATFSGPVATFTEPGQLVTKFSATISWGDGGSSTVTAATGGIVQNQDGSFTVLASHLYGEEVTGLFFGVQVTDVTSSGQDSAGGIVDVLDASLTATATPVTTAAEGVAFNGEVATFIDANPLAPLSDFPLTNVTIAWGDGATTSPTSITQDTSGVFHVFGSHTYSEEGKVANPLQVTVNDIGGAVSNTTSYTPTVADAGLTIASVTHPVAIEGINTGTVTVAAFTDAAGSYSDIQDLSATITWADGQTSTGAVAATGTPGSYTVTGSHTYAEEILSASNFTVAVKDSGGSSASKTISTATVADAGLTIASVTHPVSVEGVNTGTVTVTTFTDAAGSYSDIQDLSATITWADGQTSTGTVVATSTPGSYTVTGSHTYAEEITTPTNFTVAVKDTGGASASKTISSATVADAIPSAGAITGPTTGIPGQPLAYSAPFTDTGKLDTHTGTFAWGDGTSTTVNASEASGSGTVSATHTYAAVGTYTITLTVADDEGTLSAPVTFKVTVTRSAFLLNPSASGALTVSGNAIINLSGSVVVDSNSSTALIASGNASVTASQIIVVGGDQLSGKATLNPSPILHGSAAADPLAGLTAPGVTGTPVAINLSGQQSAKINPGVYSQIQVSGQASLTMTPGIYVIAGGGFTVSGSGSVTANGVMIYNAGSGYSYNAKTRVVSDGGTYGSISLGGLGTITLTAPAAGQPYTGISIFQSRSNTRALALGGNATSITGTIYAPAAAAGLSGNVQLTCALVVSTLSATGNAGAFQLADGSSSAYVASTSNWITNGILTVAAQDDTGNSPDANEVARLTDAMSYLNQALGSFGVSLSWAAPGTGADVHVHLGGSTPEGGASDGVLGFTTAANDLYLVTTGWDFSTSADGGTIGANQYDFLTLATHELAHTVGLGESSDPNSVMYEYLAPGTVRRTFTDGNLERINTDADRFMKVALPSVPASPSQLLSQSEFGAWPAAALPRAVTAGAPGLPFGAMPAVVDAAHSFGWASAFPASNNSWTDGPVARAPALDGGGSVLVGGAGTGLVVGGEGRDLMVGGFGLHRHGKDHAERTDPSAEGAGTPATQVLDQFFSRADLDLADLVDKAEW